MRLTKLHDTIQMDLPDSPSTHLKRELMKMANSSSNSISQETGRMNKSALVQFSVNLLKQQQSIEQQVLEEIRTQYLSNDDYEEGDQDISGSDYGLPDDESELVTALTNAYITRNGFFHPQGKITVDYEGAIKYLGKIRSAAEFHSFLRAPLSEIVEGFCFAVVFAYGAKTCFLLDLAICFSRRVERMVRVLVKRGIEYHPNLVSKLMSLWGFHTIVMIGLGLDGLVKYNYALSLRLVLLNKGKLSPTITSAAYGNFASICYDYAQRKRWLQCIDALPSHMIAPYYDAYRVAHVCCEFLLKPDGVYSLEDLTKTISADERAFREYALELISKYEAKMATHSPYLFLHVNTAENSLHAIFAGSKSITHHVLGNYQQAIYDAERCLNLVSPEEIPFFATILMFSVAAAIQVAIMHHETKLVKTGLNILEQSYDEVPRARHTTAKLAELAFSVECLSNPDLAPAFSPIASSSSTATTPVPSSSSSNSGNTVDSNPSWPIVGASQLMVDGMP